MAPPYTEVTLSRSQRAYAPSVPRMPRLSWKTRRVYHRIEHSRIATVLVAVLLSALTTAAVLAVNHLEEWWFVVPVVLLFAVIAGRILGDRLWPEFGIVFSRFVLRCYAHYGNTRKARLLITPFADFVPGRFRQAWESTAFATGVAVILGASAIFVFKATPSWLMWISLGLLVVSCTLTFVLVPHWAFARLGLRISQPGRFVVHSIAESYDKIVRVGNGAILLVALFYGVGILADRSTRFDWYITMSSTLGFILGVGVVVTGTAAAYFKRHEERVVRAVAEEARRLGFASVRMDRL